MASCNSPTAAAVPHTANAAKLVFETSSSVGPMQQHNHVFDTKMDTAGHSSHTAWLMAMNSLEEDKTPTAENAMFKRENAQNNNNNNNCTLTNFDNDGQAHAGGMMASPFGRILTPRARIGGSNTSTPRSEHNSAMNDSSSYNTTGSYYSTDTSATSGISSGLDEMMENARANIRSLDNTYRGYFHHSNNSSSNMALLQAAQLDSRNQKSLDDTELSLSKISMEKQQLHQQQQQQQQQHGFDHAYHSAPTHNKGGSCSLNSSPSGSASLNMNDRRFSAESGLTSSERSLLEELLLSANLQKQRQAQHDQLDLQQLLRGQNSLLTMESLLSAARNPLAALSTEEQVRLLLQNQEILQILSSPLLNSYNSQQTNLFGNNSHKGLLDSQSAPILSLANVNPTLNSLNSESLASLLPSFNTNGRLSHPELLNNDFKSPHAVTESLSNNASPSTATNRGTIYSLDKINNETNTLAMAYKFLFGPVEQEIEKAAHSYRNSASFVAQQSDAAYHWSGKMPQRNYSNVSFSRKVFLGGVPWDITSEDLINTFRNYGEVTVMWPNREQRDAITVNHRGSQSPKGYCYIIFNDELSVKMLLDNCTPDRNFNGAYFRMASPKFKTKDVQVIPWVVSDSIHIGLPGAKPDSKKTVFVGALHGMITAEALFMIMNDLFGNVVMSALDTDKYKYPIGSGRVVFATKHSYVRAVTANFVDVRTAKFSKTIQIDPYLEDSMCNNCFYQPGIYFCRSFECFRYFCTGCWQVWHNNIEILNHKPLRRSFKTTNASERSSI